MLAAAPLPKGDAVTLTRTSVHAVPEGLAGQTRNGAVPSSLRFLSPEASAAGVSKSRSSGNAKTEPVLMISASS